MRCMYPYEVTVCLEELNYLDVYYKNRKKKDTTV